MTVSYNGYTLQPTALVNLLLSSSSSVISLSFARRCSGNYRMDTGDVRRLRYDDNAEVDVFVDNGTADWTIYLTMAMTSYVMMIVCFLYEIRNVFVVGEFFMEDRLRTEPVKQKFFYFNFHSQSHMFHFLLQLIPFCFSFLPYCVQHVHLHFNQLNHHLHSNNNIYGVDVMDLNGNEYVLSSTVRQIKSQSITKISFMCFFGNC